MNVTLFQYSALPLIACSVEVARFPCTVCLFCDGIQSLHVIVLVNCNMNN